MQAWPGTAVLVTILVHLGYAIFGLAKFSQDGGWLFGPELPLWGAALVCVLAAGTAGICVYVANYAPTHVRMPWAFGVTVIAIWNIVEAAHGTMLEMATTEPQLWLFAAAELLIVVPLFWFSCFMPRQQLWTT